MSYLRNDSQLKKLCPDGIWWERGDEKSKRFVVVSIVTHSDGKVFEGRAFESYLLLVKAVMLSSAGGSATAAAARIDALLENAVVAVPGYGQVSTSRDDRIRTSEPDAENSSLRWLHHGGRYAAFASVASN